jgi:hypothetical protein
MAKLEKKIGWQKYEDYIEKQLSCPILQNIIHTMISQNIDNDEEHEDDDDDDSFLEEPIKKDIPSIAIGQMMPLTPQIIEDVSMLSNFDCWIGHTNFDITPKVKEKLNKMPGVEILKIFSRYRFFVGIGEMFDFQDVRFEIEDKIIKGEFDNE